MVVVSSVALWSDGVAEEVIVIRVRDVDENPHCGPGPRPSEFASYRF